MFGEDWRRREMHRDAAIDYGLEEQRKAKERDEEGLCLDCGYSPQHPEVAAKMCVDCWRDSMFCCHHGGCDNPSVVEVRQRGLCSLHAIEAAHGLHKKYLAKKSELEEEKQMLEDLIADVGYDPREHSGHPPDAPDRAAEVENQFADVHFTKQDLANIKRQLERIKGEVDEVFPENYHVTL